MGITVTAPSSSVSVATSGQLPSGARVLPSMSFSAPMAPRTSMDSMLSLRRSQVKSTVMNVAVKDLLRKRTFLGLLVHLYSTIGCPDLRSSLRREGKNKRQDEDFSFLPSAKLTQNWNKELCLPYPEEVAGSHMGCVIY